MKKIIYTLILICLGLSACQKKYLAKKSDKSLLIPTTLTDFQNLLDNLDIFNIAPTLPVIASDDFYGTDAKINAYSSTYQKNSYIWAADIDEGQPVGDWNTPYSAVFYANVVLDGLDKIISNIENQTEYNRIKGTALFHRAYAFYNIAQMYAKPYNAGTASTDLGIPIRLVSDVNIRSTRGTLQQTYSQIISDLTEAETLLPLTSAFQSRPNSIAAKALLARVYLNMENYEKALDYAKASLALNNTLIDYNTLSKTAASPFPATPATNNVEVLFYSRLVSLTFGISTSTTVDDSFYKSYETDDLRKIIFYTSGSAPYFKGRYTGSTLRLFGGLANDEMYLIKAECEARSGDITHAMNDLNTLLKTRWSNTVTYPVRTATSVNDALNQILSERRKELAFRGLRWGDLRRLNKDSRFAATITRTFNGVLYTLLPNSNRYTFPIPSQEILVSGIEQNER